MYIKIHKSYRTVVAICDSEILGKKFEEGNHQLDLRENFYKDRQINHEEAVRIIKMQAREDATFNIVGPKAIKAAVESGLISEGEFASIQGIPFTLVF